MCVTGPHENLMWGTAEEDPLSDSLVGKSAGDVLFLLEFVAGVYQQVQRILVGGNHLAQLSCSLVARKVSVLDNQDAINSFAAISGTIHVSPAVLPKMSSWQVHSIKAALL